MQGMWKGAASLLEFRFWGLHGFSPSFEYEPDQHQVIRQRLAKVINNLRDAVEASKVVPMTIFLDAPCWGKSPRSQFLLGSLEPSTRGEA